LEASLTEVFPHLEYPTAEEFVQAILMKYSIAKDRDASQTKIVIRLHPQDWSYYYELQQSIARLLPEESKRPCIDLTLTDSSQRSVEKSIGIAGGTGPLTVTDA
jgi:capsule polysaccharide modification protein KpsS